MDFIKNYLGTIIVAAVLVAIVTLAVMKIIRNRKNGKSSCGGDCSGCSGGCSENSSDDASHIPSETKKKNILHEDSPLPRFHAGPESNSESEPMSDGKDKRNEDS